MYHCGAHDRPNHCQGEVHGSQTLNLLSLKLESRSYDNDVTADLEGVEEDDEDNDPDYDVELDETRADPLDEAELSKDHHTRGGRRLYDRINDDELNEMNDDLAAPPEPTREELHDHWEQEVLRARDEAVDEGTGDMEASHRIDRGRCH
jgi:hypothetical protein